MRWYLFALAFLTSICPAPSFGQKLESYMHDLGEALAPYGSLVAPNCHQIEMHLTGPWGTFATPKGVNAQGEITWMLFTVDSLQINVNLADLDEDHVLNKPAFSLGYLQKHKDEPRPDADSPMVMFNTIGLNNYMTVKAIDPDKVHAAQGKAPVTESQMGAFLDSRKGAIIVFDDQQHADAFEKALKKSIILCKAS